jgi:hypothetical protein
LSRLASAGYIPQENGEIVGGVLSATGTLLIVIGACVINKESQFPGWWAVLPTLGAVLIISAGASAYINRVVLSNRVLVWFGLISFPLYLWHWPLLSFAQIIEGETPSVTIRSVAVLISIALAWLTYRFVESPLRVLKRDDLKAISFSILMVLVGSVGFITYKQEGFGFRGHANIVLEGNIGFDEIGKYLAAHNYQCSQTENGYEVYGNNLGNNIGCVRSKTSGSVDVALVGDSHAGHLFYGLAEELSNKNILFVGLYGVNGLPFVTNANYKKILSYLLSDDIKTVIIANYWEDYIASGNGAGFESELLKTVDVLVKSGKTVYIATDVPRFGFDPSGCKYTRLFKTTNKCSESSARFEDLNRRVMPALVKAAALSPNVIILDTKSYFCDASKCSMQQEGKEMFADSTHLNLEGSRYVAKKLVVDYPSLK